MECGQLHSVALPLSSLLFVDCHGVWPITQCGTSPYLLFFFVDCHGVWPITQCGSSPYLLFSLLTG